jgi:hypothetical protein
MDKRDKHNNQFAETYLSSNDQDSLIKRLQTVSRVFKHIATEISS